MSIYLPKQKSVIVFFFRGNIPLSAVSVGFDDRFDICILVQFYINLHALLNAHSLEAI